MCPDELYHYGIKGMKWGVRRYQNKDGTLTPAGKKRIAELYGNEHKLSLDRKLAAQRESTLKRNGVSHRSGDADVIRKGTVFRRVSDTDKEDLSRRKYVSLTNQDAKEYRDLMANGLLGTAKPKNIYEYRLEAMSDLTVATGQQVIGKLLKEYGSKSFARTYAEYERLDLRNNRYKTYGLTAEGNTKLTENIQRELGDSTKEKWAGLHARRVEQKTRNEVHKLLYKNQKISSEMRDYYAKKGYDAIVDMEDYLDGFDYPLILLTPSNSVTVKSVRKV